MEELQTKCLHYEKGLGRMQGVHSDPQDELKIIAFINQIKLLEEQIQVQSNAKEDLNEKNKKLEIFNKKIVEDY